jgi:hypothetical protein
VSTSSGADDAAAATDRGGEYAAWIAEQYAAEFERKRANEAGGQAIITTAGALLGLLTAIAALSPLLLKHQVPEWVQVVLWAAMALLVAAVAAAIAAGHRHEYDVMTCDNLATMLDRHWHDKPSDARFVIATARLQTIRTMRKGNGRSARMIHIGRYCLLAFFILMALAIALTVVFAEPTAAK